MTKQKQAFTGHLPAWRIGFDSRELLPICLDLLERQRKGLPYQQITELAARPQDCTSRTDVLTGGKI